MCKYKFIGRPFREKKQEREKGRQAPAPKPEPERNRIPESGQRKEETSVKIHPKCKFYGSTSRVAPRHFATGQPSEGWERAGYTLGTSQHTSAQLQPLYRSCAMLFFFGLDMCSSMFPGFPSFSLLYFSIGFPSCFLLFHWFSISVFSPSPSQKFS